MRPRGTILGILALTLSACASHGPSPETLDARYDRADDAECRSFGDLPGTEAYAHCRDALAKRRANAQGDKSAAQPGANCKTSAIKGELYTFCQ